MRRREGWFLIICIVILIALIFLTPSYGWKVRGWLEPLAPTTSLTSQNAREADGPGLAAENQALKAELAKLQAVASQLPKTSPNYLRAMVYSRYPLNFKNEILVDVGANEGVREGRAVVFQGVLIGRVEKVFADSALVQTVFDSGFKMPVRVGSAGYDALLLGGAYPRAASIQKNAAIKTGDIVYAAAEGLPYGLPIALVASTSTSPNNLFEEAVLGFAYNVHIIQTVLIAQ